MCMEIAVQGYIPFLCALQYYKKSFKNEYTFFGNKLIKMSVLNSEWDSERVLPPVQKYFLGKLLDINPNIRNPCAALFKKK